MRPSTTQRYDVYIVSAKSDAAAKIELLIGEKPVTSITVPAYGSAEPSPARCSSGCRS